MKPRIPHPLRDPACNLCDIIKYGYFHQLRLLICSGVLVECRDACRRTPIMLCAFMEPETWGVGTARTLIEIGVRLDGKDKFGRNVLHYACIYERFGLIHVLLKAIDFDLNQSDKLGNTALHYAAMSGNGAITQLISRFFMRYKITPGKLNKNGLSASEEASRLGNTSCARIIDQDGGKTSAAAGNIVVVKELHFDQLVSSGGVESRQGSTTVPQNGTHLTVNYRPSPRPASATFLTRRDSAVSFNSVDDRRSSCSYRSRSNISRRGSHRSHQSPLLAMGIKREEEVIYCADEKDFRNTPDFVFKLLHLPFDIHEWNPMHNLDSTNRNNAWADTGSTNQSQAVPVCSRPDWRQELKSLFKVYESQCSTSWRAAPKPPVEEPEKVENEEEERGKKSRRHSNHARPGVAGKEQAAAMPDLRRRPSTTRVRRLSSVHGTLGKISVQGLVDGNFDTTGADSINGAVSSSSKKRGSERDTNNSSGRPESISSRAGSRRPSLEPSCPSSPCTSPTPPLNVTNGLHTQPRRRSDDNNIGEKSSDSNDAKVHNNIKPDTGLAHNRFDLTKMRNYEKTNLIRRPSQDGDSDNQMENAKVNLREKSRAAAIDKPGAAIGIQISVPQVKESLVPDCGFNSMEVTTKLDTTRLWVQNPYDGNDDDDILSEDDDDGDSDRFLVE